MAGIAAVGGLGPAQFQAEYQIKTAKLVQDATKLEGDLALKLLASAAVPQGSGQNLNIQV